MLVLETATDVCSLALCEGPRLLAALDLHLPRAHGALLAPAIEQLLGWAGLAPPALAAVAVSAGPGSYTGLRIGLATAKGLCFALGLPLVAVPTLAGLAAQAAPLAQALPDAARARIVPLLDARRREVYVAHYDAQGRALAPAQAHILTEESFLAELAAGPVLFVGAAAAKLAGLPAARHPQALLLPELAPSARALGPLAAARLAAGQVEDLAGFEPLYLKPVHIGPGGGGVNA